MWASTLTFVCVCACVRVCVCACVRVCVCASVHACMRAYLCESACVPACEARACFLKIQIRLLFTETTRLVASTSLIDRRICCLIGPPRIDMRFCIAAPLPKHAASTRQFFLATQSYAGALHGREISSSRWKRAKQFAFDCY